MRWGLKLKFAHYQFLGRLEPLFVARTFELLPPSYRAPLAYAPFINRVRVFKHGLDPILFKLKRPLRLIFLKLRGLPQRSLLDLKGCLPLKGHLWGIPYRSALVAAGRWAKRSSQPWGRLNRQKGLLYLGEICPVAAESGEPGVLGFDAAELASLYTLVLKLQLL